MLNDDTAVKSSMSGFWEEKVYVLTNDFEIRGSVFMPKTGKKSRILSDILNGEKRFVALKGVEIKCRKNSGAAPEKHDFIQINLDSVIIIRTLENE